MPTFSIHTLGCKLNSTDSGAIASNLEDANNTRVPFGEPSDITVINTCTVTEEAERKCRQLVRRAIRANPDSFVVVTGCYAQLRPQEIAAIPGVSAVVGNQEKNYLHTLVGNLAHPARTHVEVSCYDSEAKFARGCSGTHRTRAFLKIQDGCDYSCSFCTIPAARGPSRSGSTAGLLRQVRELEIRGVKEVVLSGVNLGLFGLDTGENLLDLLVSLDAKTRIQRYRISSIEPNLLSDEIIDFVASSRAFMPHFHIPLQSASNHVLGKMRRRYRRELYKDTVAHIRASVPHAAIGADVIVGFPGETSEDFAETATFLGSSDLTYLHVFTYSERPNTPARHLPDPVPRHERKQRNAALTAIDRRLRAGFASRMHGSEMEVLWEDDSALGRIGGYTPNYIRIQSEYNPDKVGAIESIYLVFDQQSQTLVVGDRNAVDLPVLAV